MLVVVVVDTELVVVGSELVVVEVVVTAAF